MVTEFSLLGLNIKTYAFFLMLALIISSLFLKFNIKKLEGKYFEYLILTFLALTIGIYGSQLFASFEGFIFKSNHSQMNIFSKSVLSHGKNFLGGIVLFFPFLLIYSKFSKLSFTSLLSVCCISVCIGYGIGRIGCLISGDGCYGIPSNLPWAMSFENGLSPTYQKVHPTPLYESVFSFILFIFLQRLFLISKKNTQLYKILFIFFFLFGLERFLVEFIRLNEIYFIFTQAQWLSLIMMIVGIIFFIKYKKFKILQN
jgi:phosphatidylglycerol---prolipoprotein diacylglyceryl transferase